MAERVIWKAGDVVNIRLRDDLYTIGQMQTRPVMRFFDLSSENGIWEGIDLSGVDVLFRVFVGKVVIKELVTEKLNAATGIPGTKDNERYWISPYSVIDGAHYRGKAGSFHFLGGKLVDTGPDDSLSITAAPVVREDLSLPEDRDIILKYELDNMWGANDLRERLCRYFDTGINRDDLKFEVFPGLWNDREKMRPLTCRLPVPLR